LPEGAFVIRIIDTSGKEWIRKNVSEIHTNIFEVNVSMLSKGAYSVIVQNKESTVIKKFIKQ
jgi:hypothetical protein